MARFHYYVVHHLGEWKINYLGHHFGPYGTGSQAEAIQEAIKTAHKIGSQGHDSQVLVQGADNQWRTEWTYGHDPYPPKG